MTILEKVPVTNVVLSVQNTNFLMSARDTFSKKCPGHTRDNSQKSVRDTQKVLVTNLEKVPVTTVVLSVQNTTFLMSARDTFSKKCP